ncbi:MAG: hypothetical protein M1335_08045 [Chloroflexi bacterium]|nr:hypothetical protein [Chloroflexota bacterium]
MRAARALRDLFVVFVTALSAAAQEPADSSGSPPAKERKLPFKVHGFLLGDLSVRTNGERPAQGEGGAFVLGEERLRLDISGANSAGSVFLVTKGDLVHDAVVNSLKLDLREAYGGYTKGPVELRFGRQIVTWGVGDLFFINDVFPKDWNSFFSGRPMEYLKLGVDAVQVRYNSAIANVEFLAIPFYTPDTMPSARRFFFFNPFSGVPNQTEVTPPSRVGNSELALRVYRRAAGFDISGYAYRGYWRSPSMRIDDPVVPTTATRFYPELSVYGASAQRNLAQGVLSLEAGYYDSRQDRRGVDPSVPNSQWRFLAGYQRQPWRDCTIGIQGYSEVITRYGPYQASLQPGGPREDQVRGVLSARLTQLLRYQTWTLSVFAAYSPTDQDYFLQPEAAYKLTDRFSVSAGANLFGGESRTTFFGQFARSNNVFLNLRYDF